MRNDRYSTITESHSSLQASSKAVKLSGEVIMKGYVRALHVLRLSWKGHVYIQLPQVSYPPLCLHRMHIIAVKPHYNGCLWTKNIVGSDREVAAYNRDVDVWNYDA